MRPDAVSGATLVNSFCYLLNTAAAYSVSCQFSTYHNSTGKVLRHFLTVKLFPEDVLHVIAYMECARNAHGVQ